MTGYFTGGQCATAKRPIAALKEVTGIVKLQSSETKKIIPGTAGGILYNGDRIMTGDKAGAALLFVDGSMLKIQENSEVTIEAQRKGEQQLDTKVDLPLGQVWAKVTKRNTKFDIETPSSVASVKGTEFLVTVEEDGGSEVAVLEGIVDFVNEFGKVTVKKNQKSQCEKNTPPEAPKKLTKKDKEELEEAKPNWQLHIKKPSENKAPNQSFEIQVKSLDIASGNHDTKCTANIAVSSTTDGGQLSLDGASWSNEVTASLSGGVLNLQARCRTTKNMDIIAAGEGCKSAKVTVIIEKTRQQKREEAEKAKNVAGKAGISEVDGMQYAGGEVKSGSGSFDDILNKIEKGELEIVGKEVIEGADGKKKVILKVRPASGGKTGQ